MSNNTLNLITYDIPMVSYLNSVNGYVRPVGFLGNLMFSMWGTNLGGFNITYGTAYGKCIVKNTTFYNKVCLLHKGLKDATITGFPMLVSPDIIDYLDTQAAEPGIIMSVPQVGQRQVNILQMINVLSGQIWMSILLSLISMSLIQFLRLRKVGIIFKDLLFTYFRCHLDQTDLGKLLYLMSNISVLTLLFYSLNVVQAFRNSIHTDMVANDYSKIVDSLSDLCKLKEYIPLILDDDAFIWSISKSKSNQMREVWSRVVTKSGTNKGILSRDNVLSSISTIGKKSVLLGLETSTISLFRMACGKSSTKYKTWKAKKPLNELRFAYFVKPGLEQRKRVVLTNRARRLLETGTINIMKQRTKNGIPGIPFSETCETETVEALFEMEDNQSEGLNIEMIASLFAWLSLSFAILLITLLVEIHLNK